jgi:hypothetical protein
MQISIADNTRGNVKEDERFMKTTLSGTDFRVDSKFLSCVAPTLTAIQFRLVLASEVGFSGRQT